MRRNPNALMMTSNRSVNNDVLSMICDPSLSIWIPQSWRMTLGKRYDHDLCELLNFKQLPRKILAAGRLRKFFAEYEIARRKTRIAKSAEIDLLIVVRIETRNEETDLIAAIAHDHLATAVVLNPMRMKQTAARPLPRGRRTIVSQAWPRAYFLTAAPRILTETVTPAKAVTAIARESEIATVTGSATESGTESGNVTAIETANTAHAGMTMLESAATERRRESDCIVAGSSEGLSTSCHMATSVRRRRVVVGKTTRKWIAVIQETLRCVRSSDKPCHQYNPCDSQLQSFLRFLELV